MSEVDKLLQDMLKILASKQATAMLADFDDPEKRTPAFYNAVTQLLKHHKMEFDPVAAAKPDHPLGQLAGKLPPTYSDDDDVVPAVH